MVLHGVSTQSGAVWADKTSFFSVSEAALEQRVRLSLGLITFDEISQQKHQVENEPVKPAIFFVNSGDFHPY